MPIRISVFLIIAFYLATSEWIESNLTGPLFVGIRHIALFGYFFIGSLINIKHVRILKIHLISFVLILSLSIFNFYSSVAPLFNYFIGGFFTFLFLFVFILAKNIPFKSQPEAISVLKIFAWFILISSIGPIVLTISQGEVMRYNFGIYREVGAFGSIMNFGVIISLGLFMVTKNKSYIFLAFFLTFGVFLTILKKTILSNLITWLIFLYGNKNSVIKAYVRILFILFLSFILLFVGEDILLNINQNSQYLSNVGSEGHVRLGMYLASFNIANDFFPFGSGFSSFGSLTSITNMYSPLYDQYNVSNIGANSYQDVLNGHHTLLDTFWPHIIAELGYVGLIIFLFLWFFPYFYVKKMKNKIIDNTFYSSIAFIVTSVTLVYFWEGFTLYTPETPLFIFLHSGLTGMLVGTLTNKNI